jgi:hypothetical protein
VGMLGTWVSKRESSLLSFEKKIIYYPSDLTPRLSAFSNNEPVQLHIRAVIPIPQQVAEAPDPRSSGLLRI